jgi:hypothetical protein
MTVDPHDIHINGGDISGYGVQINAYVRGDLQVPSVVTPKR